MDDWFSAMGSNYELPDHAAQELRDFGLVVLPGLVPPARVAHLATAYDAAVSVADPADVGTGGPSTRVHDFVNRGPDFDDLYMYKPILAACCSVICRAFKLSTMHARTLNPWSPAQGLHMDFPRGDKDRTVNAWPMVGFIVMIDEFRRENGATRFVPGSHLWPEAPAALSIDHPGQVSACGPAGAIIVFNGSVWHGHGANETGQPRRSIQGAYIRRDAQPSFIDLPARMRTETLARVGPLAKYLLAV